MCDINDDITSMIMHELKSDVMDLYIGHVAYSAFQDK